MDNDDWIYLSLLIVSMPIALLVKKLSDPLQKQLISSGVGTLMIATVCGMDGLHPLLTATVNNLIVCFISPRFCHVVSFIWCFGYIVFFRTTHYFGLPQVVPHANAVQLLLTLKMVGMAFEVHDSWKLEKDLENCRDENEASTLKRRMKYQSVKPSLADMFFYSFCFIGLLTGPYYKFRIYIDMIHNNRSSSVKTSSLLFNRMKYLPLIAGVYLVGSSYFSIRYVRMDEFYVDSPLWYRVFYMFPMFTLFRFRFYIAWLFSESICMLATLGAYPAASKPRCGSGPTDYAAMETWNLNVSDSTAAETELLEFDFETVHNIDIYGCELAPTVRDGMRSWNMSVQYWLASNIYKRLPFISGPLRVAVTMMVSAFWHGVHPGYYLSFITIPPNLIAEDMMIASFRKGATPTKQKTFDWLCWFFKMRCLEYMCMGFLLLRLDHTLRYWGSIYFLNHVLIAIFIVFGILLRLKKKRV